ncbi:hypothetical Protein YC6258_00050 [Gynuella sunshinyii YC6258]|uniref:Uncharacterized protein n=1 Tax=Gynuella sunshinyii YC6258 TaxID=1445510 RepID=A0A0C5VCX0_9GAMM|nr:hypothetical Protein YC6258_00050 [Gynuella sunshinyii YC6258]
METISYLQGKEDKDRYRILKRIVLSKPGAFLFIAYIALFYVLNGILGVLIEKSGIA